MAQETEGQVTYEEKIKLNIELPPEMAEFADKLPKERKSDMALSFNAEASLYKNVEQTEEPEEMSGGHGGMTFKMRMDQPDNEFFQDLSSGATTEMREFMGKRFLIKGEVKKYNWKLTGEQKEIHGYLCQKATFTDSTRTVEAWFAPQIPVPTGPDGFGGLPGLILELRIDNDDTVITAQSVSLESIPKSTLKAPKKGQEVTQEEFDAIVEEKTKEMESENGGGNVRFIQRRN